MGVGPHFYTDVTDETKEYHIISLTIYTIINLRYKTLKIEKYTELISNNSTISYYCDKVLTNNYNLFKYHNYNILISLINAYLNQILIKITELLLDNQLEIYGT